MAAGILIDVCRSLPGVSINCPQVNADGYEPSNLISADINKKRQGFMAGGFIKPPVEIVLTFPCVVHLSHVVIRTFVGSQKSNGFEITISDNILLGRTPFKNTESDKICFVNRRFFTRTYPDNESQIPTDSTRLYIRTPSGMSRLCIKNLKIRILSTIGSSIPCMGTLEVWGVPSVVPKVEDMIPTATRGTPDLVKQNQNSPVPVDKPGPPEPLEVPSEFLDALTCEMMSLPVLLPSGNTVDQTSVDRHVMAEAKWGRCPSDPFTGIPYGTDYKPLPNVPLKSRIDKFLLDHGAHLTVPRTVGGTAKAAISRLLDGSFNDNGKRMPDDFGRAEPVKSVKLTVAPEISNRVPSHEDELRLSLDNALTNLKSYTEPKREPQNIMCCVECAKTQILYRLRCSHVICGPCMKVKLLAVETVCPECRVAFTSADPCKIHAVKST